MKTNDYSALRQRLHHAIGGNSLIVCPGVFDGISAKIAERVGFEALYMTGYGICASYLGMPDAGIATYQDMVSRVTQLAKITSLPLIADADTGYGGLLNVMYTVAGYEAAGAAAIQLEDQEFPKKCGHMLGRRVTTAEDMVAKIRVAVESRSDKKFLIIARTDSRTTYGLDEALRRAEMYANAGADILFIESPESVEEMERIGASFDLPLVANMVEGGRTPILSAKELEQIGYKIAIFPALGFLASGKAMELVFASLHTEKSTAETDVPLYNFQAFSSLMGFDAVTTFDRRHGNRDDD